MDPAARRARNVVLLVIVTVALPSLLLTALGAVAVRNEEAAAKKRVATLYEPLVMPVASRFNQLMDGMLEDSLPMFSSLLADAPDDVVRERVSSFVRKYPWTTNFYVTESSLGEPLTERPTPPERRCGLSSKCLSFPTDRKTSCSREDRRFILEKLISVSCQDLRVEEPLREELSRFLAASESRAFSDEGILQIAMAFARAAGGSAGLRTSPQWVEMASLAVLHELLGVDHATSLPAAALLTSLAKRSELLEAQAFLALPTRGPRAMGVETTNWRRVIVGTRSGDRTAGFELVPPLFEPALREVLEERDLEDTLRAGLMPLVHPDWYFPLLYPDLAPYVAKKDESIIATEAFLKKTDLNWALSLMLRDPTLVPNFAASRSSLYFWTLILLCAALMGGVFYMVRSVIAEAKLSRLKTDFVSSVSHDLRTPLTSIRMFSEMLHAGEVETAEERKEYVAIILDEAERLSRLVERILDFSRMEAGKKAYSMESVDLEPLLQRALRTTMPLIQSSSFDVHVEVTRPLPRVRVEQDSMIEVFVNLISNAIKYSPHEKSIELLAAHKDGWIEIQVRDRGIGISEAEQRKIFEKFYRVNNQRASEVSGSGIASAWSSTSSRRTEAACPWKAGLATGAPLR
ncbi:MAG: HAMP domain-containing histidine kinase [Myxococcales bacterium]|nr:HAMP domain-containing histidine kinase [Myxococcales bacterium]